MPRISSPIIENMNLGGLIGWRTSQYSTNPIPSKTRIISIIILLLCGATVLGHMGAKVYLAFPWPPMIIYA